LASSHRAPRPSWLRKSDPTGDVGLVVTAPTRPITVDEYHRIGEVEILDEDDRVELLDGHLIVMSPDGPAHLVCVNTLTDEFARRMYKDGATRTGQGMVV